MDHSRYKQIDELFDAALDLPDSEREAFIIAQSQGDEELKKEVLSLLKAQTDSNKFLEKSAMGIAAKNLADEKTILNESYLLGKTLSTYKIESLLGSGGMGEVYLASDTKLRRKVALKILPAEYVSSDERVKRFQLEARAISVLNHPNIVTVYDVGSSEGINFIATEYVEGKTFRELVGSGLRLKEILSIVIQVCEALSAAHNAGIIHRDIKPENIILRPDGYVKILDFGLVKLSELDFHTLRDFNKTAKGVIIGTPAYMSPEQVADEFVDHRTDLWSIGVVLYELLTGINPYKKENRQATFQAILSQEPPLPSSINPEIPQELDQILVKALEKDADLSYQTASDLRADLKRVRRELFSSPSLRSGSAFAIPNKSSKSLSRILYFLIPLTLLIGIGVFFFFQKKSASTIDWTKSSNTQLTQNSGTEFFPSLSPDGKVFVYAADTNGNFDIYIQRISSKKAENLTQNSNSDDTMPAFSPDGERIAFRSEREPRGIYVMGLKGENIQRISDFGFHPSWSPDGKEIVVSTFGRDQPTVRANGEHFLKIINLENGSVRDLIKLEATFPAWSPNGKRIAYWFYSGTTGKREIATISKDGGEPKIVAKDFAVSNWNPVWSPDGNFLYFVSSRSGSMGFWRVKIDEPSGEVSSEPEPVNTLSKYSRHLGFSKDGKRLIYVQTNNQSNIQGIEFDSKNLKPIGAPFWITQGDREIVRPELSPDGKTFQMRIVRLTQDDLVLVNRDGQDWRDITNDDPFDRYSRWSPDGKQIAFSSDRAGNSNVWICNADGTNQRQITFPTEQQPNFGFPVWSPDGKRLSVSNGTAPTYIIDLAKNWNQQTPQKITPEGNSRGFVAWDWSPDGTKLVGTALKEKGGSLAVYDFQTNGFQKIIEDAEYVTSWLPDSRHFIYSRDNKIFIVDSLTKEIKELFAHPTLQPRAPFVSRDGKLLYYAAYSAESDIWMMDLTENQ
jgi:serine/threonine protein kinase